MRDKSMSRHQINREFLMRLEGRILCQLLWRKMFDIVRGRVLNLIVGVHATIPTVPINR